MVPTCQVELAKQSSVSPDRVRPQESLLLAVVEPYNWEGQDFKKDAFQKEKLKNMRQSVARQAYSSPSRIDYFVYSPLLANRPERKVKGVISFTCEELRALVSESGQRQFMVVDAPLVRDGKIDFAHAHIGFSPEVSAGSKNVQAAAVQNLKILLNTNGPAGKAEDHFPIFPLLHFRWSELRLLCHRMQLWASGAGARFIETEAGAIG